MKGSRVVRSTNFGNPKASTNSYRGTTLSANLSKKERYPPSILFGIRNEINERS